MPEIEAAMPRPRHPSADDLKLWRQAVRDVAPLRGRAPEPAPEPVAPTPTPVAAARPAPTTPDAARPRHPAAPPGPRAGPAPPASAPILPGIVVPGIDRRTAERLRRGRIDIAARIDLHGMSQAEAHLALAGFLDHCWRHERRMVLVITGKGTFSDGQGILRVRVPDWLNASPLRDKVLAFHPAQQKDGGAGALYVLLKRRRDAGR